MISVQNELKSPARYLESEGIEPTSRGFMPRGLPLPYTPLLRTSFLAESVGFEPTDPLAGVLLSRQLP